MRTPRAQIAAAMLASALPGDIPERRRIVAHSEPHGVAAALKAEAPQPRSLADYIDSGDADRQGMTVEAIVWRDSGLDQRAARKVRMAAKRRRGWM